MMTRRRNTVAPESQLVALDVPGGLDQTELPTGRWTSSDADPLGA
jgi:hypothetical protein